jgi:hypothetical protein
MRGNSVPDPAYLGTRPVYRREARIQSRSLDYPSLGRGADIAGIRGSLRLYQENVRFAFRDGPMLDALGNHKDFARTERHGPVSHLNRNAAAQNEEKVVRVVVFVPHEFALNFCYHDVVAVELSDNTRLPVLGKQRQFLDQIYGFHAARLRHERLRIIQGK